MNSKKKFVPTLYPLSRDLSKKWFVEFVGEDGRKKKLYGRKPILSQQQTISHLITHNSTKKTT